MNMHVTTTKLTQYKAEHHKIVALTAYDYPTARIVDTLPVDLVLVGDSVGEAQLGYDNTLQVTMNDMIHHTKAVNKGIHNALLITDMPFMSFQASPTDAIKNAGRCVQEGGAHGVKVEGGRERIRIIGAILDAGIPVLSHIGLTPQSLYQLGGYKVQGKTAEAAKRILDDALLLQEAGVFALVLELVPHQIAKYISEQLTIPTIGIGSGPYCDGQVLVINDILGLTEGKPKKHSRQYANLSQIMKEALLQYATDVQAQSFPGLENAFEIPAEEYEEFLQLIKSS